MSAGDVRLDGAVERVEAEVRDSAGLLLAGLDTLLTRYEDALQQHEIPRPY